MTTQNLLLILLAVTLVFGFGVVLIGRRSGARTSPKAVDDESLVAEVVAPIAPVNRWGKQRSHLLAFWVGCVLVVGSQMKRGMTLKKHY